jgi:hypothetical protein
MPMWEGAGNLARDYSGHGNHGSFVDGPEWVAGGIYFDGNKIEIPNFDPPHQGTVCASLKTTSMGARDRIVGGHDAFEMVFESTGQISNNFFAAAGDVVKSDILNAKQLYNVACTWDYVSTNNLEIYIDGTLNAFHDTFADDDPGGPFTLSIGTRTGSTEYYTGFIGALHLFDAVLSAAQAKFINDNPYFMYQIPEELYGYVAGAPPTGNPFWYYNMLRRRN